MMIVVISILLQNDKSQLFFLVELTKKKSGQMIFLCVAHQLMALISTKTKHDSEYGLLMRLIVGDSWVSRSSCGSWSGRVRAVG